MTTAETNDLITEVTQLPVQPGAAMRLLWMLEDPRTSAADLGRLIESDAALSTQVIRLANTDFYGVSGKVSNAWRAVTVLGLATVRAIATTAAFDLFSEKGRSRSRRLLGALGHDRGRGRGDRAPRRHPAQRRVQRGLAPRPRHRARVPPRTASLRHRDGARARRTPSWR